MLKMGSSDFQTGESEPMTHIRPIICVALLCCAVLFALPAAAAGIIYDNGPRNGTIGSFDIKPQQTATVFDDFFSVSSLTANGLIFAAWLNPGDVLISVQADFWVDPSDPEPYFSANLLPKQTGCDINKQGYQVCIETGLFFSDPQLYTGTFWLELSNAHSQNNGWIGGDINNGVGCTSTPY